MRLVSLFLATLVSPSAVASAQEKAEPAAPSQQEMAARYMKNMAPGPRHAHLEPFVGSWEGNARHWMAPGMQPMSGKASTEAKSILGGRFVRFEGAMQAMGMKHEVLHVLGYDNAREKYVLWFVHSMSTGFQTAEGTCDGEGKTFTLEGVEEDPGIGWKRPFTIVIRLESPDAFVVETTFPSSEGKEFAERAEVSYKRKKPGGEGG